MKTVKRVGVRRGRIELSEVTVVNLGARGLKSLNAIADADGLGLRGWLAWRLRDVDTCKELAELVREYSRLSRLRLAVQIFEEAFGEYSPWCQDFHSGKRLPWPATPEAFVVKIREMFAPRKDEDSEVTKEDQGNAVACAHAALKGNGKAAHAFAKEVLDAWDTTRSG